jgi:hypothetical protein
VTALGAIANAAAVEIDAVAVQHELGGIRGVLAQFSSAGSIDWSCVAAEVPARCRAAATRNSC